MSSNYSTISRPYSDTMSRDTTTDTTGASATDVGSVDSVASDVASNSITGDNLDNLYINTWIKSTNYTPKTAGFYIDGKKGYIECMQLYAGGGGIIGGKLDIPDTTSVASFHVDSAGNTWWGSTDIATSVARVLNTGIATFSNAYITGGNISTSTLDKGLMSWTTDIIFTSTSATQIDWSSGHIVTQDDTTYNILAGNTGSMIQMTYVYFDIATPTILATSIHYEDATGDGKILVATAQNNTTAASVIPFGGGQPIIDGTSQISALSITAAAIAASTITAAKMNVTNLSSIKSDLGTITAGNMTLNSSGYLKGGQSSYNTGTGFWLGYDAGSGGSYKLSIGNPAGDYLLWDGSHLTLNGSASLVGTLPWSEITDDGGKPANYATVGATWGTDLLNIPTTLTTPSLAGLYLSGNYLGYYSGSVWNSYIDNAGNFYFKGDANSCIDWNITTPATLTIKGKVVAGSGSSIGTGYLSGTIGAANLNIADAGWSQNCIFAVTNSTIVAWGSGTFTSATGATYSITAGNTGGMSQKTYIYLDIGNSTTAYQTTTTATTAVGAGKVLIATAINGTVKATYILMQAGGIMIDASSITAGSITANEIAASTITAANMNVTTLSSIAASLGTITAGTITLDSSGYIRGGQTAYNTGTGFFLGYDTSAYKFSIGNPAGSYLTWDGTDFNVKGSVNTTSGSSIGTGYLSGTIAQGNLSLANMGWTQTCVFSVTNSTKVSWTSGVLTTADGTSYSISAGDTGTMAAMTYIYFNYDFSTTAFEITTTATSAVGAKKILIGVAVNGATEATFQVFGGIGGTNLDGSNIVTGSVTSNELGTGSVTSAKGNLALRGWTQTCAFTLDGTIPATKIGWGVGTFTASDGTAYSISAGNTGVMSAKTYIYLDIAVSSTAYQTTTTATTAIGDGKVLVAIAQNGTGEATFLILNNNSYNIDAANIVAGSITSNEIKANTITASQIAANTITASEIAANTITASQIAANTITASQIAANTVTASQIAANTITAGCIHAGAIESAALSTTLLYAGTITLDTLGNIKGGQSAYNTGTGFFLGYSTDKYKFSIGNPTSDRLTWDGSTLEVSASRLVRNYTAGINLTAGQAVYMGTDGKVYSTDSTISACSATFIGFCTTTTSSGDSAPIMMTGVYTGLSGLVVGDVYYLKDATQNIDQQQTSVDHMRGPGGATDMWQSFTVGAGITHLSGAAIGASIIGGNGNGGGVYSGEGVGGTYLYGWSKPEAYNDDNGIWFDAFIPVTAGNKYTITLSPGTFGQNTWAEYEASNLYADGKSDYGVNYDRKFKTYYTTNRGLINTSAGTNSKKVGIALSSTDLLILNS